MKMIVRKKFSSFLMSSVKRIFATRLLTIDQCVDYQSSVIL